MLSCRKGRQRLRFLYTSLAEFTFITLFTHLAYQMAWPCHFSREGSGNQLSLVPIDNPFHKWNVELQCGADRMITYTKYLLLP